MFPPNLLTDIAFCPQMQRCLAVPNQEHPCRAIVTAQRSVGLGAHRLPQPWSGQLRTAPILFISPNPSWRAAVAYPTGDWDSAAVAAFFNHRFEGEWVKEGTKAQLIDGSYSRSIRFWVEIRQRANELLQRSAVPGRDYALTHIVHCEAVNGTGVAQAQAHCTARYLDRVVEAAGARVIVVLGRQTRVVVQQRYGLENKGPVVGPVVMGDRDRWFAFLPHTNARGYRSFQRCVSAEELTTLCEQLAA